MHHAEGFHGLILLRDRREWRRYLIIETWDSAAAREAWQLAGKVRLATPEEEMRTWIESRADLGAFEGLAHAGIRPRSRRSGRRDGSG
ncbi:hypothetical protein DRN98_08000 [Methanosarcinales archaeon]|nr:MAG: hypothetical protein DRN98_08000 [Methanosarcinales archaeon]